MRIVLYSQHVLGVGHLFRSLEIARALFPHQVDLITGGERLEVDLPGHVRHLPLPTLCMDDNFRQLRTARAPVLDSPEEHAGEHAKDTTAEVDAVMTRRKHILTRHMRETRPDVFLVELFPFGRKRFGFELLPILHAIRRGETGPCAVVCSVRDILVEKADQAGYEKRVAEQLNSLFDLVLVHADPELVRLEETFASIGLIKPRIVYTGYVAPRVDPVQGAALRASLGVGSQDSMIVASIGGGAVGRELLEAVLEATAVLQHQQNLHVWMFAGPFMDETHFAHLCQRATDLERVHVLRFAQDFGSWLAAADLSVSMAGYNTTMNLLAAQTFGLVMPFTQNREQLMRAQRLERRGLLRVLHPADLVPDQLARRISQALGEPHAEPLSAPGLSGLSGRSGLSGLAGLSGRSGLAGMADPALNLRGAEAVQPLLENLIKDHGHD